jgi:hypothetical protein
VQKLGPKYRTLSYDRDHPLHDGRVRVGAARETRHA